MQNASTTPPESLSGLIERVPFHHEENGWAVLKVKAKGHRDLVTVVGLVGNLLNLKAAKDGFARRINLALDLHDLPVQLGKLGSAAIG